LQGTRASYAVSVEVHSGIAVGIGNAALRSGEWGIYAVRGVRGKNTHTAYMHSYISYSGPEGSEAFHTFFHMLSWEIPG
jgi:hypothetical protein